jgi:lantibiotic modifying enzyme
VPIEQGVALATAAGIADHLCRTAFFHDGRCNWCGTVLDGDDDSEIRTIHQTLGPDLYDGTSGIALFLGEAFVRVGDPRFRTTADAGIARALDKLETIPRECRFGLYTGTVGVVYAAVRLGDVLERPDLILRARDIIAGLTRELYPPYLFDVIAGTAGAIPMLLMLADALEMPELRLSALKLGEAIVAAASKDLEGWSWGSEASGIESARNLTGFAHGAAGIGWSLLELYRKTNETRFLNGALEAFRYEDRWFQPAEDNWPDFRWEDGAEEAAPCMVAWCHGAAGIGLARLAALRVRDDPWLRRDAEAAVRACMRVLADSDAPPDPDFCLCHGQSGIAAFLLRAGEVLGDVEARDLALTTAAAGVARFAETPQAWPVGVPRGSTPSLMTGLAGIGYFYLGIADPKLPSVLLLQS